MLADAQQQADRLLKNASRLIAFSPPTAFVCFFFLDVAAVGWSLADANEAGVRFAARWPKI